MELAAQMEHVVVATESAVDDDPVSIVESNIHFVNLLRQEGLLVLPEINVDALRSYYVDFFEAQLHNGGFSQFVYNSRWNPREIEFVTDGLREMGAVQHLRFLTGEAVRVADLGTRKLQKFLDGDYFSKSRTRDKLDANNHRFFEAQTGENLRALNAGWLKNLPHLMVLPQDGMAEEMTRLSSALPDREARLAHARSGEPRYLTVIRALCEEAGLVLGGVTMGDPTHAHAGKTTVAWHFLTEGGHHYYMVDTGREAIMFDGTSHARVAHLTI
jgi:hypothetical protein